MYQSGQQVRKRGPLLRDPTSRAAYTGRFSGGPDDLDDDDGATIVDEGGESTPLVSTPPTTNDAQADHAKKANKGFSTYIFWGAIGCCCCIFLALLVLGLVYALRTPTVTMSSTPPPSGGLGNLLAAKLTAAGLSAVASTTTATPGATLGATPGATPVQPADISINLLCNKPFGNGTCRAVFTYENTLAVPVAIEVGEGNRVTPGWPDRGQPQIFAPGLRYGAATFLWDCASNAHVHWVVRSGLSGMIATASASAYALECPGLPTAGL